MLKVIGIILVVAGVIGILFCWYKNTSQSLINLKAIIEMLYSAEYVCVDENVKNSDFFIGIKCTSPVIEKMCNDVGQNMLSHAWPTGMEIWRNTVISFSGGLFLGKEEMSILLETGTSFFSKSQKEKKERIRMYRGQFERAYDKQIDNFKEKKKIYIPLGLMGGILVIIILL